jgi:hypothetical protein
MATKKRATKKQLSGNERPPSAWFVAAAKKYHQDVDKIRKAAKNEQWSDGHISNQIGQLRHAGLLRAKAEKVVPKKKAAGNGNAVKAAPVTRPGSAQPVLSVVAKERGVSSTPTIKGATL